MKKMKKILRKSFCFFVTLCLVISLLPMPAVKAAVFTAGDLSLSITDGQAMLTIVNDASVTPIQLTKKLVTKDGAIDPETGTVYLRWMSNSLYAYNYALQKNYAKVELILVDTGVTSLEISSSNVSVLTGYYTAAGRKSLLTLSEIKSKLGIEEETEEEKKKREEEEAKKAAEEAARKKAEEEAAKKKAEEEAKKKAAEEAAQKAAEEAAKKKAAEEAAKKQQQTTQQQSQQTNTQQQQQSNTAVKDGISVVKTESGKAAYVITKSGKTVRYVMPLKNVDRFGVDKNGTLWLKGQKGCLYIWNYELQGSSSAIKLLRVTSKKCTGLAFSSSGKVTGYYLAGSIVKKSIWSKSKIKKALAGKSSKKKTKEKAKKATSQKKYIVVAKDGGRKLLTTKGRKKDSFRFKNNTVIYHGVIYKNVRTAVFNEKGTLLLLANDDSLIAVNKSSFKLSKKATNVSHFNHTKWGTVRYAVYKTGTRFKVSNY